ncbi:MAG: ATP-binding protein [Flavobacterium lindanitolerans]|uniref:ATP-binding protein n=1 Tax=Flavobacterium lindanitolerans TaxID=428988 RepID=UPI001A58599D|nr:ATP-binding protein [Flavobacterium lindanitolerans]MBL7868851.1 ATP-binding protein [Flavobacterium lindanitolerans]
MTNVQKNEILNAIQREIKALGSANKAAVKCDVSNATISNMINNKHELIKVEMWMKVAGKLGVQFSGWQIAETTNFRMMQKVLADAKNGSLFIPVSYKAGSGKTAGIEAFVQANSESVYRIEANEWAKREFLMALALNLGIEIPKGAVSVYQLGSKIVDFFNERAFMKPLLIIDEADKLKAPALRFLIPFFNKLEDKVGVVIAGTENLEKEINKGVKMASKGYDELASRFGRNFIHLIGATSKDIELICNANGITDKQTILKIFDECNPAPVVVNKQAFKVVEDMRRVKRVIKRELLTQPIEA